jgi:NAD(P)-dependent dehydrogenase (short-subunit alcohol dehydrogenase family)
VGLTIAAIAGGIRMRTLNGKIAVVTGAASGIGRCLGHRFAAAGSRVAIADLDVAGARRVAAEIIAAGGQAHAFELDVTSPASVHALRAVLIERMGPPDVVVNNAGIVHGGAFLDVPLERHVATFRVNVEGLVNVTHALLPDLLARPEAHLVTIASASSFVGLPFGSTYGASKWAALGFAESLRLELQQLGYDHIGLTAVCPSYVGTGMFGGVTPPRLTRILTPERVADLTVKAVLANKAFVLTPWLVRLTPLLHGVLPRPVFEAVAAAFGVNTSMASWRGRE